MFGRCSNHENIFQKGCIISKILYPIFSIPVQLCLITLFKIPGLSPLARKVMAFLSLTKTWKMFDMPTLLIRDSTPKTCLIKALANFCTIFFQTGQCKLGMQFSKTVSHNGNFYLLNFFSKL